MRSFNGRASGRGIARLSMRWSTYCQSGKLKLSKPSFTGRGKRPSKSQSKLPASYWTKREKLPVRRQVIFSKAFNCPLQNEFAIGVYRFAHNWRWANQALHLTASSLVSLVSDVGE